MYVFFANEIFFSCDFALSSFLGDSLSLKEKKLYARTSCKKYVYIYGHMNLAMGAYFG